MTSKIIKIAGTALLLGAISLGTTACSNSTIDNNDAVKPATATPIPIPSSVDEISSTVASQQDNSYIVGPITGSLSDLTKAKVVRVPAGSSLIVDKMDSSEHSQWTATSSDEKVATFVPGINGEISSMIGTPPSFNVLATGTSNIVMTNSVTGQTVKFSIEGIPTR